MADQRTSVAGVEDLLVNILKRLPVKCLGRFRCVCKSWSSLISSGFFLTSHHDFTVVSNTKISYFMLYYFHKNPVLLEYDVYHPQQEVGESITYLAPPYSTDLMDPYKCPFPCARFTVTGVINGVVCLHTSRNIVVWNPSIHKHIILRYHRDASLRGFVGFGFNANDNDFKVVVFLCGSGPWYDVLSVQDGFWRRRPLPNYIYQNYCPGSNSCFVNGTLYWMARNSHNDSAALLLFDCKREEFKTKEIFPAELAKYIDPFTFCPFKHGDMLSMLISAPGGGFELWAMEEEGYTWSKLYTLGESFIETGFGFMPRRGINFCSDDLPTGLGEFHQPLDSQAFEESLFLMDVKGQFPPQLAPCLYCSCHFRSVVLSLV